MKKSHFKNLIDKYINRLASNNEIALLDRYFDKLSEDERKEEVTTDVNLEQKLLNEINSKIDFLENRDKNPIRRKLFPRWLKVAAIFIVISSFSYFIYRSTSTDKSKETAYTSNIKPGGNKATLTLGNGKSVDLNKVENGTLATLGNSVASKITDGELSFVTIADDIPIEQEDTNILEVPVGGFYKLVLSDGTKVWLNSASSLTFATNFIGNRRRVKLNGEAYFEVAHNPNKPFIVETDQQEIEVLGTHFNINAYKDEESTKITLMEGSVKVITQNRTEQVYLKPGEQSVLKENTVHIAKVDVSQSIDWINGRFNFNNSDVKSVMRKIARWYNIDVTYQSNFEGVEFGGKISKKKNLQEILDMLSRTGEVKFKVKERRIIVMP